MCKHKRGGVCASTANTKEAVCVQAQDRRCVCKHCKHKGGCVCKHCKHKGGGVGKQHERRCKPRGMGFVDNKQSMRCCRVQRMVQSGRSQPRPSNRVLYFEQQLSSQRRHATGTDFRQAMTDTLVRATAPPPQRVHASPTGPQHGFGVHAIKANAVQQGRTSTHAGRRVARPRRCVGASFRRRQLQLRYAHKNLTIVTLLKELHPC